MKRCIFMISLISMSMLFLPLWERGAFAADTRGLRVVAKDPASGQQQEVKLYNKSYAVIIGIDQYQNLPPDRQLTYAVRDAKGVEEVLRKNFRFDRIITLYNQEAGKERILKLLTSELAREMTKEDALFIFWAGHGNQEKTDDGDLGYLIPYDGTSDGIYGNITMSQLRDDISRAIPAKHVFYAMDACYSGLLTTRSVDKTSRRDLSYLKEITKERVRQVLTAGGKGEEVLDGGPKGHSVFTGRLIEILEATGDFITANEIQAIIREKVYGDARGRGHNQTPGFGTLSGSGDFVFIPNVEQKLQDNRAEIEKMEKELAAIQKQEAEASRFMDEQKRRDAEMQKHAVEAKLRAEKLKQEQLSLENKRQEEERQAQQRFTQEQQQRDVELARKKTEDEQRLAALKVEIERKKQGASNGKAATLDAAIAEIKRLSGQIDDIEQTFSKEQAEAEERITSRYNAIISELKKNKVVQRDEFDTEAEYKARKAKTTGKERIIELEQKRSEEVSKLQNRISEEQLKQTEPLRLKLAELSKQEYSIDPRQLVLELGQYNVEKGVFPISITSRVNSRVKVAINGAFALPRDSAREFKQHFNAGLLRPEVKVIAGSGETTHVVFADDANNAYIGVYEDGAFITLLEKKRREEKEAERIRNTKDGFYFEDEVVIDSRTGLMWTRNAYDNRQMVWDNANKWVKTLSVGGYRDWRLPTKEELTVLVNNAGNSPWEYFRELGFTNVAHGFFAGSYWSSSIGACNGYECAWIVNMNDGSGFNNSRSNFDSVWPVRNGQF